MPGRPVQASSATSPLEGNLVNPDVDRAAADGLEFRVEEQIASTG